MPRITVTDDELEMLTEEERLGLKEYQAELEAEQAAEDELIRAAGAAEPEDKPKVEKTKAEKPKAEEPAVEEAAIEEEGESDDDEEAGGEPEEEADPDGEEEGDEEEGEIEPLAATGNAPSVARLTDAEEARLGAIKGDLKALAQKFDDGELTAVEWRDQQEVLEDERDTLKEKKTLAAMSNQTAVNTWYHSTIPIFMAAHPEYTDGSLRHKLLDTIVRELQMSTQVPTDPKILAEAHTRIVKELGAVAGAAAPKPKPKPKAAREGSPNFSAIPASDPQQVGAPINKFARLDKLSGVEYERALAKLTPADRDHYLQGG